jgi:hypothetical protein
MVCRNELLAALINVPHCLRKFGHCDMLCCDVHFWTPVCVFLGFRLRTRIRCGVMSGCVAVCNGRQWMNVGFTGAEFQQPDHCTTCSNGSILLSNFIVLRYWLECIRDGGSRDLRKWVRIVRLAIAVEVSSSSPWQYYVNLRSERG